ncbi:hypothetical protein XELAEV_18022166mg [Xenopus laevis]|uniref:Uncharacterized protein n=1 Tax=Xenopus laevis TaxID=8355 RepID=A0A974D2M8_XENLA|nr:hypothetical protein XELAEV_18022166mg [Xenopus laevis]
MNIKEYAFADRNRSLSLKEQKCPKYKIFDKYCYCRRINNPYPKGLQVVTTNFITLYSTNYILNRNLPYKNHCEAPIQLQNNPVYRNGLHSSKKKKNCNGKITYKMNIKEYAFADRNGKKLDKKLYLKT